jgi:hypothetical protein
MSTQLIGFSIGGIARRFLVAPPSMIWPANLVLCALFNTLHSQNYAGVGDRGGMSRERFFFCAQTIFYALLRTYANARLQTLSPPAPSGTSVSHKLVFVLSYAEATHFLSVPGYLFTALSNFNWVCWIAPDNIPVNEMFGYSHGMGMSLITFDWAQIAYIGSPLATPWWAAANVGAGFVVRACRAS